MEHRSHGVDVDRLTAQFEIVGDRDRGQPRRLHQVALDRPARTR
jgi:hypothetical protein